MFNRVSYDLLNPRQQENYNYAKIATRLADYGFNCMRLSDDWRGADFVASHIDDEIFLKVQPKGRLTVDKKYCKKEIFVVFISGDDCYVYPHDEFLEYFKERGSLGTRVNTNRWDKRGVRSWRKPPLWALEWLVDYKI